MTIKMFYGPDVLKSGPFLFYLTFFAYTCTMNLLLIIIINYLEAYYVKGSDFMTLSEAQVGQSYYVISTDLDKNLERRLEALGLTDGTKIELLNKKRNGTSIFNVRGTRLAVGEAIARGITVESSRGGAKA